MPFRSVAADDIFISYTRRDAAKYAAGLAAELNGRGFSCFTDMLGTVPAKDVPDMVMEKIRSCAMFVVVCTERAATRDTIHDEVKEFIQTGRRSLIVPIDFGGFLYRATWYSYVEGIAPAPEENPKALEEGTPSPSVISRIEKQFTYARRNQRLRRATFATAAVLLLLLLASAAAGVYASRKISEAEAARVEAAEERAKADGARADAEAARKAADAARKAADAERKAADDAKADAGRQRDEAARQTEIARDATRTAEEKTRLADDAARRATAAAAAARRATAEAERQQAVANSRSLADRSQTLRRQRPHELPRSVTLATDAAPHRRDPRSRHGAAREPRPAPRPEPAPRHLRGPGGERGPQPRRASLRGALRRQEAPRLRLRDR
jgi:hypothetical protein